MEGSIVKAESLPLHLKYRPRTFDEIVGNEEVVESLKALLRKDGVPHSFLFQGPSGCGKTTLARIVARELGCDEREFYEYNVANVRGIDTIREIIQQCRFTPIRGRVKVYVLDECHQLTKDAQNALLKVLEDTPKHVYFILCTTDPEKLIKTIRTRCVTYSVTLLPTPKIVMLLKRVCESEGVNFSPKLLREVARASGGCPRKALVILDSVIGMEDEEEAMAADEKFVPDEVQVVEICRKLIDWRISPSVKWREISRILKSIEDDPEQIRYMILNYMAKVLLDTPDDRIAKIMALFQSSFLYTGKAGLVYNLYLACKVGGGS